MKNATKILLGIGVVALLLVGWIIGTYNSLVAIDEEVNRAWADVETEYQRRFDLIPNLQAIVQGSADFQKSTFKEVTEARSAWAQAKQSGDISGQIDAAQSFDSALSRLLVTVESYPDLDTEAFLNFQSQLEGTENRISYDRGEYNKVIQKYNTTVRRFPAAFIASLFGFQTRTPFEALAEASSAPSVEFSYN